MASLFASLGPRARRVLRYVGFAVLALVSFVFALQATFPYDRVKDTAIQALSGAGYDAQIGDVERSIMPARVYFKAVTLRNRPTKASDIAATLYIEQAEIDVGLLSLLHGTFSGRIDLKIGPGHLKGRGAYGGDGLSVHVTGDDLPAASLPMRDLVGIPMSGKIQLAINLQVPNEKSKTGKAGLNFVKGEGNAELSCPSGCVLGDGKTKLKLSTNDARQQEFLDQGGGGIDFGKVSLDSFAAAAELKGGKLDLTRFELKSPDGEAHVAFGLTLNQDFGSSSVTGCLRFHGSEALRKREPKTDAALSTTGGPLGPDGLFHIKLEGTMRRIFRRPLVCGQGGSETPGSPPPRPNLTVSPEPAKPPNLGKVGFPAPPPPPAAPPPEQPIPTPAPQAAQPQAPAAPAAPPPPAGDVVGPPPTVFPSNGSAGVPGAAPGSNPSAPSAPGAPQ
ncbi:MAG TPA: type II secretion system protein GspN [Kofleriaceae bacterium]|jgi:type II secretion system protein N|nr:type II secretion system protein GspN [Kofleriaceae bacterium]